MDFLPDVIGGDESDENEVIPEVVKVDLNEDDVFDDDARKPSLKMKSVKEEEPILPETHDVGGLDVEDPEPPVQIKKEEPVKKQRKKRVMTEEQKQKLSEARKKALVVRRANAQKKKEIKMLKQAKQDEELDDLRKSVRVKPTPKPQPVEQPKPVEKPVEKPKPKKDYIYTQEDMDTLTFRAIANYDEIRKVRKKEKAKKREVEQVKTKERQKLMSMVSKKPVYDSSQDFWGNCF
jgi:hypothetical protein